MSLNQLKPFLVMVRKKPIKIPEHEIKQDAQPILRASIKIDQDRNELYKGTSKNIKELERLRAKIYKDFKSNRSTE